MYDYADAAKHPRGKGFASWLRAVYRAVGGAAGDEEREDAIPLPVFVPLGGCSGPEAAIDYVAKFAGVLAPYLADYLRRGQVVLLLDALNEMPRNDCRERVASIQKLLDDCKETPVVVTCRELDYVEELKLEKLEVKPLNPVRQREFLCRYLGAISSRFGF